jgi:hypothetical protein
MSGLSEEQKAFIKVWTDKGYKLTLTPEERASGLFNQYSIPGSNGIFPDPGLKMWISVEDIGKSGTTQELSTSLKNQSVTKESCKRDIEDYFNNYKQRNVLPNIELDKAKIKKCKRKFYKNWSRFGLLDGGNKLDAMLDVLYRVSGAKYDNEVSPPNSGKDSEYGIVD